MAAAAVGTSSNTTGLPTYHQVPETKYERKNTSDFVYDLIYISLSSI